MKKYFKSFLLLIFTLILSGCTKEEVTSVGIGKTININTLDGVYDFSIKVKEVVGFSKLYIVISLARVLAFAMATVFFA